MSWIVLGIRVDIARQVCLRSIEVFFAISSRVRGGVSGLVLGLVKTSTIWCKVAFTKAVLLRLIALMAVVMKMPLLGGGVFLCRAQDAKRGWPVP